MLKTESWEMLAVRLFSELCFYSHGNATLMKMDHPSFVVT